MITSDYIKQALAEKAFKNWPTALVALCFMCEKEEVSLRFDYHPGWFTKPDNDTPYLDKSKQGYTIEVGLSSYADDEGNEAYYPKPSHAVHNGLRLLKATLEERAED